METRAPGDVTIAILSDIHHAGPAERARGEDYEFRTIANPLLRPVARAYRHLIWMRHPLDQGRQLDRFLAEIGPVDYVVANGDYPCDTAFVGVSDPASFQSAQECLGKLRAKFGDRVRFTIGDHELGQIDPVWREGWNATGELALRHAAAWPATVLETVHRPLPAHGRGLAAHRPARKQGGRAAGRNGRNGSHCARRISPKSAPPSTHSNRNNACCCSVTTPRRCRFCGVRNRCAAGCRRWNRPSSAICTRG